MLNSTISVHDSVITETIGPYLCCHLAATVCHWPTPRHRPKKRDLPRALQLFWGNPCLCTVKLHFISSSTSPPSLPLSPWYCVTAYTAWRPLEERREIGQKSSEQFIWTHLPLYTFSPNYHGSTYSLRHGAIVLIFIFYKSSQIPADPFQWGLLWKMLIHRDLAISCIRLWFRNIEAVGAGDHFFLSLFFLLYSYSLFKKNLTNNTNTP